MYYFYPWKEPQLGERQKLVLSAFDLKDDKGWKPLSLCRYLAKRFFCEDQFFVNGTLSQSLRNYVYESLTRLHSRGFLIAEELVYTKRTYTLTPKGMLELARLHLHEAQRTVIADLDYPRV